MALSGVGYRKRPDDLGPTYMGADKSLARPGRKQATATEDFDVHISHLLIIIGGILVLFVSITRLASNEIFSPSNKIHWNVGRSKDLSAPWYRTTPYLWAQK